MAKKLASKLDLRVDEKEAQRWRRAAARDSRPLSSWMRERLNEAAKRELGETERR